MSIVSPKRAYETAKKNLILTTRVCQHFGRLSLQRVTLPHGIAPALPFTYNTNNTFPYCTFARSSHII